MSHYRNILARFHVAVIGNNVILSHYADSDYNSISGKPVSCNMQHMTTKQTNRLYILQFKYAV